MFGRRRKVGSEQTPSIQDVEDFSEDERENLRMILRDLSFYSEQIQRRAEIALLALQQKSKGEIL